MLSFDDTIPNLVETFSAYDRCFTAQEIVSWAGGSVDDDALRQALLRDDRLLFLGPSAWGMEHFIPRKAAVSWWSGLTTRLVAIGESRLHERQLAAAMNSLYRFPLWAKPAQPLLEMGLQNGWVAPAWRSGCYVFPVAHLISQVSLPASPSNVQLQLPILEQKPEADVVRVSIMEAVQTLLDRFDGRTRRVVMEREGIPPYKKATLEELGAKFGVTRERVRQLEGKFWRKMFYQGHLPLILQGLVNFATMQGGLVISTDDQAYPYVQFAAKCLGIQYTSTKVRKLILLGTSEQVDRFALKNGTPAMLQENVDHIAALLDSGPLHFMDRASVMRVAQALADDAASRLTKQEKVYLALEHIGRSAHYSEVARVYGQLYPDDEMSEHNIHAILSRCASPDLELHGIVLVGVKGTYGLKQHGYKRPGMRLFDTVTKIVEEKYAIGQRPVHINVIISELGKYRREVNPASLAFATGMNSDIHQIEKDYFVPKNADGSDEPEDRFGDLDMILRGFQEAHTSDS